MADINLSDALKPVIRDITDKVIGNLEGADGGRITYIVIELTHAMVYLGFAEVDTLKHYKTLEHYGITNSF